MNNICISFPLSEEGSTGQMESVTESNWDGLDVVYGNFG